MRAVVAVDTAARMGASVDQAALARTTKKRPRVVRQPCRKSYSRSSAVAVGVLPRCTLLANNFVSAVPLFKCDCMALGQCRSTFYQSRKEAVKRKTASPL